MCERRRRLKALIGSAHAYLQLVAQTASVDEAEDWLTLVPGLKGVVAKLCDGQNLAAQRARAKVKRHRAADCVVIGVGGDRAQPPSASAFATPMVNCTHL
jgi:ATP-dependent DNA ligase